MQLGDLLTQERVRVPLPSTSVAEGVSRLLHMMEVREKGPESESEVQDLLKALNSERRGRILRPSRWSWIIVTEDDEPGHEAEAALGIASEPLSSKSPPLEADRGPRILLLLRLQSSAALSDQALKRLSAVFTEEETQAALLEAVTPVDVRSIRGLMSVSLRDRPRVAHALLPIAFRVFPDTPVQEVVDLMARKELSAVPVVSDAMEVLGVITSGEALRYAIEGRGGERGEPLTARDVMSRAVMCISEQADLRDAAKMMVNKDMAELPVVREGEVVGLLTREAVLKALFGR